MNKPAPLHPAFVERIRRAWETQRLKASFVGALYWHTEPPHKFYPAENQMRRLRRLAVTLNYSGPILDGVAP